MTPKHLASPCPGSVFLLWNGFAPGSWRSALRESPAMPVVRNPDPVDMAQVRRARRYETRPGRTAVLVDSLDELRGPSSGIVELPHHLLWQPNRRVDLDDDWNRKWAYSLVLREALSVDDLRTWLDGATLRRPWPSLNLPTAVRRAWEARLPVLDSRRAPA
jgi:hypothetical protein